MIHILFCWFYSFGSVVKTDYFYFKCNKNVFFFNTVELGFLHLKKKEKEGDVIFLIRFSSLFYVISSFLIPSYFLPLVRNCSVADCLRTCKKIRKNNTRSNGRGRALFSLTWAWLWGLLWWLPKPKEFLNKPAPNTITRAERVWTRA